MAKKAAKKPAAPDPERRRQSILFAAIEKFASKRVVRSDLVAGDQYKVAGTINGRVFRSEVSVDVEGILSVGHPTTYQSNSAAKPVEIVAALLPLIPKTKRVALLKEIAAQYAATGKMPVKKADVDEASAWVNSIRSLVSAKRAGAVSFKVGE